MSTPQTPDPSRPGRNSLAIDGMSCGHCVRSVRETLAAVPGIAVGGVAVGSATIDVSESGAVDRAVAALVEAGFAARPSGDR